MKYLTKEEPRLMKMSLKSKNRKEMKTDKLTNKSLNTWKQVLES